MNVMGKSGLGSALSLGLLFAAAAPASAQSFAVGETVEMHIGAGPLWRPCTVIRNEPRGPVMRLRCPQYKTPDYFQGAGEYVVERRFDSVRKAGSGGGAAAPGAARPVAAPAPAGGGGALKVGEYACYGSGGRIMAGLGFRVLGGGRYTDLDGGNAGTYSVSGGTVSFKGGHMGGQSGRELKNGNFRIGAQASCEPF